MSRLSSLILVVVSLAVGDALIGLLLPFFSFTPTLWRGLPVEKMHVIGHPYRAYMLTPGQRFWNFGPDQVMVPGTKPVNFGISQDGVLVDDYGHLLKPGDLGLEKRPKAANERRILFLGNSTTFQPWPFLVADLLTRTDTAGRTFVAIDAGTGGYTSQENLIDLQISGFMYQPDMVVAYLPAGDVYHAAHWQHFKRDYTHMRIPLEPIRDAAPPEFHPHAYPFTWKLVDTLRYKSAFQKYAQTSSLTYHTNKPDPFERGHVIDEDDYRQTADAVIENVLAMQQLCEGRGITFVLVTQKMFPTEQPYYKVLNAHTLDAAERIKRAPRLASLRTIEAQALVADTYTDDARRQLAASFPGKTFDFDQPVSYDGMHFNPTGVYLFASVVGARIQPILAGR